MSTSAAVVVATYTASGMTCGLRADALSAETGAIEGGTGAEEHGQGHGGSGHTH
ncbi:hypothetical protein ACL02R_12735 [Streptomyces sp. MS19]|uniref:hypothetical protein n=1 Tax=Streptomyces sp. MS19 TaxID=3385972 RepID=UPI0039A1649E